MKATRPETFDIISLTAGDKAYHTSQRSLDIITKYLKPEESDKHVLHNALDIPLGQSRYAGCIIDIPEDFPLDRSEYDHPTFKLRDKKNNPDAKYLRFAAQLNLADIAPYDTRDLLPKTGHLYVFADIYHNTCKVIYADVRSETLQRIIVPHEDNFYSGRIIKSFKSEVESFTERFRHLDDDEQEYIKEGHYDYLDFDKDAITTDNKVWDDFAGAERSKLFGIFTHCQWNQSEIEEMTFSDRILLLQIGENDFNDEGVFSVTISKEDLKQRNFENCDCYWAQT